MAKIDQSDFGAQMQNTFAERVEPSQQDALSLSLMRDIALQSLEKVRAEAAEPSDGGRSLPLPMAGVEDVTIGQALQAAFLQLEALKRQASGEAVVDALDWSDDKIAFPHPAITKQAIKG